MRRKLIAGSLAALAVAGGTAGAIAATGGKDDESAVLTDAAKRLGVTPDALHDALGKAEDAQIDAAVKAGTLTQKQADAIKTHRQQDGRVLGFGRGGRGPGGPGFGGHFGGPGPGFALLDDAAKALGITRKDLLGQLRAGKTPEDIAKAAGKSLDDVKAALKKSETDRLDAAVKAGKLTQAQRDEIASHLDDLLDHLGDMGHFGPPQGRRGWHPRGFRRP